MRYRFALFWHAVRDPTMGKIITSEIFSKSIGTDREQRNKNLRLMGDRWFEKGPKPEDYGLRPEDVRKGRATWMS